MPVTDLRTRSGCRKSFMKNEVHARDLLINLVGASPPLVAIDRIDLPFGQAGTPRLQPSKHDGVHHAPPSLGMNHQNKQ